MPFSQPAERVSCQLCGVMVTRSNIRRHHARQHIDTSSGVSVDSSVIENTDLSNVTPQSETVIHAVISLLEQHDRYTLTGLYDYLAFAFPEIPAGFRSTIVTAATCAAQYVANIHNLFYANRESPDAKKRTHAAEARSVLSYWALGPRITPRESGTSSHQLNSGLTGAVAADQSMLLSSDISSLAQVITVADCVTLSTAPPVQASTSVEDVSFNENENLLLTRVMPVPVTSSEPELLSLMSDFRSDGQMPDATVVSDDGRTVPESTLSNTNSSTSSSTAFSSASDITKDVRSNVADKHQTLSSSVEREFETIDPLQLCATPSDSIEEIVLPRRLSPIPDKSTDADRRKPSADRYGAPDASDRRRGHERGRRASPVHYGGQRSNSGRCNAPPEKSRRRVDYEPRYDQDNSRRGDRPVVRITLEEYRALQRGQSFASRR